MKVRTSTDLYKPFSSLILPKVAAVHKVASFRGSGRGIRRGMGIGKGRGWQSHKFHKVTALIELRRQLAFLVKNNKKYIHI